MQMKKIMTLAMVLIMTLSVGNIPVQAASDWVNANFQDSYFSIDMIWNEPEWGLDTPGNVSVPIGRFIDGDYGQNISSVDDAYDDIDYVARTIFAECINVKPRETNANAIAQVIYNRMISDGTTLLETVNPGAMNATGSHAWKYPSNDNYDPSSMEYLTQEELFIHCVYLAKALSLGYDIPTKTENGVHEYYIDVESSYNFHDYGPYGVNEFYKYANESGLVDFSQYDNGDVCTDANYFRTKQVSKKPIKIGYHVYYTR